MQVVGSEKIFRDADEWQAMVSLRTAMLLLLLLHG